MFKKIAIATCAVFLVTNAQADSTEAAIKKKFETTLHITVDSVNKVDALDLYEVVADGDIVYTDSKANYLFMGQIIDTRVNRNLTKERLNKLSAIKFSDLPLNLAIKQVKGNGKRVIASFEDPNCPYCAKLAQELQGINDITIYTFLLPILSQDSVDKTKAIWCAPDRAKAWNNYMLSHTAPPAGNCDTTDLDKVAATARKLHISGTPAIFLVDGTRLPGFAAKADLEKAMMQAAANR
jgi:thiol:disulfide interchange protein DsbC